MDTESSPLALANGSVVECGAMLRSLPDKRQVFAGEIDGRAVIVKVFLDPRRARVHFRRELDGLHAFHNAGIAAPEVLYAGSDASGARSSSWRGSAMRPRSPRSGARWDRSSAAGSCSG